MNDPSRLARLHAVKLATLVREHVGGEPALEPSEYPGGAALLHGDEAWVLLATTPDRGLGGALAWSLRRGARHVHLLADTGTGTLARRAAGFTVPISVWHVEGRLLLPAVAEPLPAPAAAPAAHHEFVAVIEASGAVARVEHGVLFGEVEGLEVCRVVDDLYTGAVRLEVGVGAHDREAFQMLHGDRPTAEALAGVVAAVAEHRHHSVQGHPLGRLVQERALRARLIAEPALMGATRVVAEPPPVPRPNLKDAVPCVAVATIDGVDTVVVCSSGVDLDAVPFAVDARASTGLVDCIIVLPARDALPVQQLLADAASPPVALVSL